MCGIAGWFSSETVTDSSRARLNTMLETIAHRGPDGSGAELIDHAALGHVRLAIIDLESGQQPMVSHDNAFCITFNGEIYNYQELRNELIGKGHTFTTHSDTEVILELYRAEGWKGFEKLRGMYAFALWDKRQQQGLLVRDPLGIKPLFIHREQDHLYFASEAKAIIADEGFKAELDTNALHQLMNFRYLPGELTLFKGIEQLPPGRVLQWNKSGQQQHYTLSLAETTATSTFEVIEESITRHLTADVEVACYLSGGIDSGLISALASQQNPALRTFTLNVGDDPNEARYAQQTAQLLNITNTQGEIGGALEEQLKQLVWHLEVPKINALQVSQLAQLTSRHVKVTLSGLGGDELFLGYNVHKIMYHCQRFHRWLPDIIGRTTGSISSNIIKRLENIPWSEPERALKMLQHLGEWPTVYGLMRNVWDSPVLREQIYGLRMLDGQLNNSFQLLQERWPDEADPLVAMAQFERTNKMVNDLLWQEDRVSMAAGLEVRTPFVDGPLTRHIETMTPQQLMPRGKLKAYMREVAGKILPDEVLNRPKSGFQVSSPDFYHQQLKPIADHWLSKETTERFGLFNHRFIEWVQKQTPGKPLRWHYFMLYLMLMTHLWADRYEGR